MKKLSLRNPVGIGLVLAVLSTILVFSFVEIGRAQDPRTPKVSSWIEYVNGYLDMDAAELDGWRHNADIGDDNWMVFEGYDYTPPGYDRKAFMAETTDTVSDIYLISPHMTIGTAATLIFYHDYEFEDGFDGGVIEISVAGGAWTDIGSLIHPEFGPYTGTISTCCNSPIGGQSAWTGPGPPPSGSPPIGFEEVRVDLSPFEGNSVRIRWRMACDSSQGGGNRWFIDNISVDVLRPQPLPFLTARAGTSPGGGGGESVTLEWLNPPGQVGQFALTRILIKPNDLPGDPVEGTVLVEGFLAGQKESFVHDLLTPFQHYYYGAFVYDGGDPNNANSWSEEKTVTAYTFESVGNVKWGFHMGATSLAPPGIGSIVGLANDKGVHSMTNTPGDLENTGLWPASWTPIEIGEPGQARPTVVTIPFPGNEAQKVIYVSSQDGKVYAIDGDTGGTDGAPELWTSRDFGELQAGVAGMFTAFGGARNLLFVGSHNAGVTNTFYAINPVTGVNEFSTDTVSGLAPIGMISGMASVDYDTNRVYFTSRSHLGTNPSVWCLSFTASAFTHVWSRALGDIDGSPTLLFDFGNVASNDRIYVGTSISRIYALNADTGTTIWADVLSPADGAIKSFIAADPDPDGAGFTWLYLSTDTRIWGLLDESSSVNQVWSQAGIGAPSAPLFAITAKELYAGSSLGKLYQLDATTGVELNIKNIGDTTSTVGSPALDALGSALYVGTAAGAYYAVELPLQ